MKKYLLLLLQLAWVSLSLAQSSGERYKDDLFPGSDTTTLQYGSNINYLNLSENLLLDIYQPKTDSAKKRAAIFFVHGGGFRNGHRNDPAIMEFCGKLAKKGYVVISIDYRLGQASDSDADLSASIVRAIQDLNAAIRFTKAIAENIGIDSNLIFISGASAGGITSLCKAFLKIDSTANKLGVFSESDLEGNTNQLTNSSKVFAVYSMWGAVFDTAWITSNDIPVACVHSTDDTTVPYISGFNKRNGNFLLYGSYSVNQRAKNIGLLTSLHSYNSSKHDLGLKVAPYKDTTVQLMSNFFYNIITVKAKTQHSFNRAIKLWNNFSFAETGMDVPGFSPVLRKEQSVQVSDTTQAPQALKLASKTSVFLH